MAGKGYDEKMEQPGGRDPGMVRDADGSNTGGRLGDDG